MEKNGEVENDGDKYMGIIKFTMPQILVINENLFGLLSRKARFIGTINRILFTKNSFKKNKNGFKKILKGKYERT